MYLIEKKLDGPIEFTTDEVDETHLSLHAAYWGENFIWSVSAVIVVTNDVMQFIIEFRKSSRGKIGRFCNPFFDSF